jgi:hypothetical protein
MSSSQQRPTAATDARLAVLINDAAKSQSSIMRIERTARAGQERAAISSEIETSEWARRYLTVLTVNLPSASTRRERSVRNGISGQKLHSGFEWALG